jgi:hypothetical protein
MTREFTSNELEARAILSHFTPDQPMIVWPNMMEAMRAEPCLADMMDRVQLYPIFDKPKPPR